MPVRPDLAKTVAPSLDGVGVAWLGSTAALRRAEVHDVALEDGAFEPEKRAAPWARPWLLTCTSAVLLAVGAVWPGVYGKVGLGSSMSTHVTR